MLSLRVIRLAALLPFCLLLFARVDSKGLDSRTSRVMGGKEMSKDEHPFLAAIYYNNVYKCGGSIISNKFILTAAHCIPTQELGCGRNIIEQRYCLRHFTVFLGVHNRRKTNYSNLFYVKRIIKHENHKRIDLNSNGVIEKNEPSINDIALIELSKRIKFNKFIRPICISLNPDLSKYKHVYVSGWGLTNKTGPTPLIPRITELSSIFHKKCKGIDHLSKDFNIYDFIFCAYKENADACQGDSGGPIFAVENQIRKQIGIVSFGVKCIPGRSYPGKYTRISSYIDWLKQHVKIIDCKV